MTYTKNNQYDQRAVPDQPEIDSVESPMIKIDMPTFEYIDSAMLEWVRNLNIFADGNKGWKQVPVLWYGAERAYQIKSQKELRDRSGTLILPLITIGRTGYSKNPEVKGSYWANIPAVRDYMGGVITTGKRIKQKKTAEFNNNRAYQKVGQYNYKFVDENEAPLYVYETEMIHIPVYLEVNYDVNIRTSYQQQMNEIMTSFLTNKQAGNLNYFTISNSGFTFEAYMDSDFQEDNNVASLSQEERQYKTKIKIRVLGYIIGEGKNEASQRIVKREGITKVAFGVETILK